MLRFSECQIFKNLAILILSSEISYEYNRYNLLIIYSKIYIITIPDTKSESKSFEIFNCKSVKFILQNY